MNVAIYVGCKVHGKHEMLSLLQLTGVIGKCSHLCWMKSTWDT